MGQADILHDLRAHRGTKEQIQHAGHHRRCQPSCIRRGFGGQRADKEQDSGHAKLHEGDGNRIKTLGIDAQTGQVEGENNRRGDGKPVAGTQGERASRLQRHETNAGQADHAGDQIDGSRLGFGDNPCGERGNDAIGSRQKSAATRFYGLQSNGLRDHRAPIGQPDHQRRHDDLWRQVRHDVLVE